MAINTQLGAPDSSSHKKGRFTLNRVFKSEATATRNVTPTNLGAVVAIDFGEPTWDNEADVLQQGGGDEKTQIKRGPRWDGTITVLGGSIGEVLSTLYGLTWGTGTGEYAAMSLRRDSDYPSVTWEAVCRDADNKTHIFSVVIQDMIIDDGAWSNPMEYSDGSIPFHTYHEPFYLKDGCNLVYDIITAGSAEDEWALTATPISLASPSLQDDWDVEELVFCKTKSTTASTGTRKRSNVTIANASLGFTAGTPASGSYIQVLYAKET